jgi:ElaB/YqjD/DUF883 family membrane-anchored ribosome-binding protein
MMKTFTQEERMEEGTVKDANVQDAVDQGKAMWQEAKAGAGDAINKASSVARDMSAAGSQAAAQASEAIQGVARQVGNQAGQAATALYERGTNAGGYVSRYTAEQPWTALLVAAAIGYGLAYLIHRP